MKSKKFVFVEYLLLTFVILWSGGASTYGLFKNWPFVLFIFLVSIFLKRKLKFDKVNKIVICLFSLVIILQLITYGKTMTTIVIPILSIIDIAMIAVIVRPFFSHIFVKIITFFALFSLFFWSIDMFPSGHHYLLEIANQMPQFGGENLAQLENSSWSNQNFKTIIFYTVYDNFSTSYYSWFRNSGPFFEPGRFTIFLNIAIGILLFGNKLKDHKRSFVLLLAANISTFSTSGYIAMIVLFLFYFVGRKRHIDTGSLFMLSLLLVVSYFMMQFSFISEKTIIQFEDTENANSRFGAVLYHWAQIVQSPIIGYGGYLGLVFRDLKMSPCGITAMMRQWGIPIFLLCVWLLYIGTKNYIRDNKLFRISFVLMLLVLAFTQTVMSSPMFYFLYFMGGILYRNHGETV